MSTANTVINTDDLRIVGITKVTSPAQLLNHLPITDKAASVVATSRNAIHNICLLYTSPSPRDRQKSRMPSSA